MEIHPILNVWKRMIYLFSLNKAYMSNFIGHGTIFLVLQIVIIYSIKQLISIKLFQNPILTDFLRDLLKIIT